MCKAQELIWLKVLYEISISIYLFNFNESCVGYIYVSNSLNFLKICILKILMTGILIFLDFSVIQFTQNLIIFDYFSY